MLGAGFLRGIGFTMSFFVADVAFVDPHRLSIVLSVLGASVLAGVTGWFILSDAHRRLARHRTRR